jgi:hypothetical protein
MTGFGPGTNAPTDKEEHLYTTSKCDYHFRKKLIFPIMGCLNYLICCLLNTAIEWLYGILYVAA